MECNEGDAISCMSNWSKYINKNEFNNVYKEYLRKKQHLKKKRGGLGNSLIKSEMGTIEYGVLKTYL